MRKNSLILQFLIKKIRSRIIEFKNFHSCLMDEKKISKSSILDKKDKVKNYRIREFSFLLHSIGIIDEEKFSNSLILENK